MQSSMQLETTVAAGGAIFSRIFVPVDFSMESHRAVGAALELQRALGSNVCIFHLTESDGTTEFLGGIGSPAVGGDWVAKAHARLHRFLDNVAPGSADRVEVGARVGADMLRLIGEEAARWGATLVVASADTHARVLRSKAEKMVRSLDIPVLLIPHRTS